MTKTPFGFYRLTTSLFILFLSSQTALSQPKHGIAMYGDPQLPPHFVSLPYANPDAPRGGRIVVGEGGSFDSLNPHARKGRVPWQLRFLAHESLMGRSYDEPFTLYGLLAESVETPANRSWVEFTLRPEARFSDGSPVTVEDVMWSFETLGSAGHPRYRGFWTKVEKMEQTGERSVRLTFNTDDRELALLAGMRPILKKDQWRDVDMFDAPIDMIPISSAPYVISEYEAGRFVVLRRNPDYWGNHLGLRRGTNNIDEIRMDFYSDGSVMFEAFKAGNLDTFRENNPQKWDEEYTFPRATNGDIVKSIIPHQRPSGMSGFVMNTRREQFQDWRVREALLSAFNFEFINTSLTGGKAARITSYFSNSPLAMNAGPAQGAVRALLEEFEADLLPGALEGYELPVSDGSEGNRRNIRKAMALMNEAGWHVRDGVMQNNAGQAFTFDILLNQGAMENLRIANLYRNALERLGIAVTITQIDSAQYKERADRYDFDMTYYRRGLSLSPGNEQFLYWGADGVTLPGTRNYMGMNSPAAEAMIDAFLNADSRESFLAGVRALDRVLMSGRYVIPFYQWNISRIAHSRKLTYPEQVPLYGDWIGFQPDVWWVQE